MIKSGVYTAGSVWMQNWNCFRTSVQFVQTAESCKMLNFSICFAVVDWITILQWYEVLSDDPKESC